MSTHSNNRATPDYHSFVPKHRTTTTHPIAAAAPSEHRKDAAVTNLAHAALDVLAGRTLTNDREEAPIVSEHCVRAFSSLLLAGKLKPALNFARMFVARGAEYEVVAEDLFSAAARRLGDRWNREKVTRVQVNIGILTLTRVHIALSGGRSEPTSQVEALALFASFPGQSHTLGLTFGAEYFLRNGWNVRYMPSTTMTEFMATALSEKPQIIGLTAALKSDISILEEVIAELRALPFRPSIIVGGSATNLDSLDADAIVTKLNIGLLAAHRLLH